MECFSFKHCNECSDSKEILPPHTPYLNEQPLPSNMPPKEIPATAGGGPNRGKNATYNVIDDRFIVFRIHRCGERVRRFINQLQEEMNIPIISPDALTIMQQIGSASLDHTGVEELVAECIGEGREGHRGRVKGEICRLLLDEKQFLSIKQSNR
jgi:hypothetical protein